MTRILMDISPKIPKKRLQKMLRDSDYTRVGQDESCDLFIATQAATDQSVLRLKRDEAVRNGACIPVMDEYELYARLWKPDCLANVLEERLDGSLRGRIICLVGSFSDQEKAAVEQDARKHRAFLTTHPDKATLFVLGHKASTEDPELFSQMLLEKARRPYVKITGRAALMEKAQASPGQKKKRKGPDMRRLYHGKPNPDSFPDRYIALDLEATSTHPNNKIIEIGMVRYVDGEPQERFQSFVNPHQKLLPVIMDLTGISDEELESAPDIQALTKPVLRFLQDDPVIGHSVQNDMKLLAENLNLPLDNNYIDTCKLAMTHLPERSKFSLRSLAEDYGLTKSTHRALDDAVTSMELLEKFRELFGPGSGTASCKEAAGTDHADAPAAEAGPEPAAE